VECGSFYVGDAMHTLPILRGLEFVGKKQKNEEESKLTCLVAAFSFSLGYAVSAFFFKIFGIYRV
jgi:hypothetical protein